MLEPASLKLRSRSFWVLLASVALMFVQGLSLHAHSLHHHDPKIEQSHEHHANIHVGELNEHDADHSSVATIDLSAVAMVKKISADSVVVAILAFCLLLLVPFKLRLVLWSAFPATSLKTLNTALRPPLRAPPR